MIYYLRHISKFVVMAKEFQLTCKGRTLYMLAFCFRIVRVPSPPRIRGDLRGGLQGPALPLRRREDGPAGSTVFINPSL